MSLNNLTRQEDGAQVAAPSYLRSSPAPLDSAALSYARGGLSIFPVDHNTKRPLESWTRHQTEPDTPEAVSRWSKTAQAMAVACGPVSGGAGGYGLCVLDFDAPKNGQTLYEAWLGEAGGIAGDLPTVATGGGGFQVFFRCPLPGRNQKLAFAPNDDEESGREIVIETRGTGGYAVLPPSLHPSGNRYKLLAGDLADIPQISQQAADRLFKVARQLDEAPYTRQELEAQQKREQQAKDKPRPRDSDGGSVIDAFNAARTIEEELERAGYTRNGNRFARPGGENKSVTVRDNRSFHHASNDALSDGYWHKPFDVFCSWEHGNDVSAAVKAAAQELDLPRLKKNPTPDYPPLSMNGSAHEQPQKTSKKALFALRTLAALAARPMPEMLIHGVLVCGENSLMTAKHAQFKTFFSLDMALCVACGVSWHGQIVKRGPVIYVAAEGAGGIIKRVRAWMIEHDVDEFPSNFHVIDEPARISEPGVLPALVESVTSLQPVLIVLDTLSRCAVGLDENNAKEMSTFMENVTLLSKDTGAHVLIVHHNNKAGEFRGSTAIAAAVDTHLSLERNGDTVKVCCEKQKNFEEFQVMSFTKHTVELNSGGLQHSLVFRRDDQSSGSQFTLSTTEQKVFDELNQTFGEDGATSSKWQAVCFESGISPRSFERAKTRLKALNAVSDEGKGKRGGLFKPKGDWCQSLPLAANGSNGSLA